MDVKLCIAFLAVTAVAQGVQQQSNYDLSRNRLGSGGGFSLRDIAAFFLGGYGQYNPDYPNYHNPGAGLYPSGPGYPGQYPGSGYPGQYPGSGYPGQYPGNGYPGHKPGLAGPPGAHAGCPLCDSSVYSYCSYKEGHDACCCENSGYNSYNCRKTDCKFLYANSCQEYNLISSCCCVDVKSAGAVAPAAPLVRAVPVVPVLPVVG